MFNVKHFEAEQSATVSCTLSLLEDVMGKSRLNNFTNVNIYPVSFHCSQTVQALVNISTFKVFHPVEN